MQLVFLGISPPIGIARNFPNIVSLGEKPSKPVRLLNLVSKSVKLRRENPPPTEYRSDDTGVLLLCWFIVPCSKSFTLHLWLLFWSIQEVIVSIDKRSASTWSKAEICYPRLIWWYLHKGYWWNINCTFQQCKKRYYQEYSEHSYLEGSLLFALFCK